MACHTSGRRILSRKTSRASSQWAEGHSTGGESSNELPIRRSKPSKKRGGWVGNFPEAVSSRSLGLEQEQEEDKQLRAWLRFYSRGVGVHEHPSANQLRARNFSAPDSAKNSSAGLRLLSVYLAFWFLRSDRGHRSSFPSSPFPLSHVGVDGRSSV